MEKLFDLKSICFGYRAFGIRFLSNKDKYTNEIIRKFPIDISEKIGKFALAYSLLHRIKPLSIEHADRTHHSAAIHGIEYLQANRDLKNLTEVVTFRNENTIVILADLDVAFKNNQPSCSSCYVAIAFQKTNAFIDINQNEGVVQYPCIHKPYILYETSYLTYENCMLYKIKRGKATIFTSFTAHWIAKQLDVGSGGFPKLFAMPISLMNKQIRDYLYLETRGPQGWVVNIKKPSNMRKRKRYHEEILNTKEIKLFA